MPADDFDFTDRYKAMGIPYPDRDTMCYGDCEGIGFVPIHKDEPNEEYHRRWKEAHERTHEFCTVIRTALFYRDIRWLWRGFMCDGWHFVKCVDCNGTGKQKEN